MPSRGSRWGPTNSFCHEIAVHTQATTSSWIKQAVFCGMHVLLQHGRLKMGHKEQPLRSKGEAGGAIIVISGIVRVTSQTAEGLPLDEVYLAAGRHTGAHACCGLTLWPDYVHDSCIHHALQLSSSLTKA